ncbi:hypothetical protein CSUB01_07319 [Colletotrichum sublineola]|uniref:Rhodopsin domain-containing protein n=1 Tax=Colletotrichum sublineola TaxID=1173701 RepID=A0A066X4K6_COLSU|nr:hypothetical protein CSUB01_07319 [Colletotrichum sublineola]
MPQPLPLPLPGWQSHVCKGPGADGFLSGSRTFTLQAVARTTTCPIHFCWVDNEDDDNDYDEEAETVKASRLLRSRNVDLQQGRATELCERQRTRSRGSRIPMGNIIELLGKTDNLSDPEPALNKQSAVLGMVLSFMVLAWICGFYRLYVRYFILQCPGWDDFFVVLSLDFVKVFYVCNGAYPMATALIKLALLLQYLRMFERGTKSRYITIVFIFITAAWGIAYSFLAWVPCVPVSAFWDLMSTSEARWAFGSRDPIVFARSFESHVSINVALDLIVFAIPIPLFLKAGLRKKSRMSLFALFAMGALVNVLGIFRVIGIAHSRAGTYPTLDPSWYGCTPIVLAAVEVNLATICASLPVFWPTLQKSIGQIFITKEVEITTEARRFSALRDTEAAAELSEFSPKRPPRALGNHTKAGWYTDTLGLTKFTPADVAPKRTAPITSEKSLFSEGNKSISDDQESQDPLVPPPSRGGMQP